MFIALHRHAPLVGRPPVLPSSLLQPLVDLVEEALLLLLLPMEEVGHVEHFRVAPQIQELTPGTSFPSTVMILHWRGLNLLAWTAHGLWCLRWQLGSCLAGLNCFQS